MFFKNILPCTCWIFLVLLVDIGGGEEMRKYPHMCSTSLGAKGGGAVIRNGGGEGGGERRGNVRCVCILLFKRKYYILYILIQGMYVVLVNFCSNENVIFCTF